MSSLLGYPIGLWSICGSILAPLFEGGRHTAQAEGAGGQRNQAAWAYRRAALTAFREVEDALTAARRLAEQRTAIAAQRDALSGGLRLAINRYRAGCSPYLEQFDAQRALLSAELSLIQIEADQLNNRIALFQAMGGGWMSAGIGAETLGVCDSRIALTFQKFDKPFGFCKTCHSFNSHFPNAYGCFVDKIRGCQWLECCGKRTGNFCSKNRQSRSQESLGIEYCVPTIQAAIFFDFDV